MWGGGGYLLRCMSEWRWQSWPSPSPQNPPSLPAVPAIHQYISSSRYFLRKGKAFTVNTLTGLLTGTFLQTGFRWRHFLSQDIASKCCKPAKKNGFWHSINLWKIQVSSGNALPFSHLSRSWNKKFKRRTPWCASNGYWEQVPEDTVTILFSKAQDTIPRNWLLHRYLQGFEGTHQKHLQPIYIFHHSSFHNKLKFWIQRSVTRHLTLPGQTNLRKNKNKEQARFSFKH